MKDFDEYLNEQLKDDEFKELFEKASFETLMKHKQDLMIQLRSAKITLGQDEVAIQEELDRVNHELHEYLKNNVGSKLHELEEKTIDELFKDYDGELPYQSEEVYWGEPVGEEII